MANRYKIAVALMVTHPSADLSFLRKIDDLEIGVLWGRGDQRQTPKGNPLSGFREESYCLLRMPESKFETTAEAIEWFLGILEQTKDELLSVTATGGAMCFSIGWFHDENFEQGFSSQLLQKLGEMQISINFDIYGKDDE